MTEVGPFIQERETAVAPTIVGEPSRPSTSATEVIPGGAPRSRRGRWLVVGGLAGVAVAVAVAVTVVALGRGGLGGGGEGGGGGGEPVRASLAPPDQPRLAIIGVTATAADAPDTDACGDQVTFDPANTVDSALDTAWRTSGDGTGQRLVVTLSERHHVTSVGLVPGYAKVDPCTDEARFVQNRTISTARFTFDDGTSVVGAFENAPTMGYVPVEVVTEHVTIEILATRPPQDASLPPGVGGNTAISEIAAHGNA